MRTSVDKAFLRLPVSVLCGAGLVAAILGDFLLESARLERRLLRRPTLTRSNLLFRTSAWAVTITPPDGGLVMETYDSLMREELTARSSCQARAARAGWF